MKGWLICILGFLIIISGACSGKKQGLSFGHHQQADTKKGLSRKRLAAIQQVDFLKHAKTMRKLKGRARRQERRNERALHQNLGTALTRKEKRAQRRAEKAIKTRHLDIQDPQTRKRMKKHAREWKRTARKTRYRPN